MVEKNDVGFYSDVKAVDVEWLWYPYIPYGKISVLQGDPGDGKSTFILNIIAAVSRGGKTPDGKRLPCPYKVIYQCSEDGIADTIKPRLEKAGANCRNVCFIKEDDNLLSLDDERIGKAIDKTNARLLVIDPVQAYVGDDGNLNVASKARRLMQKLSMWASKYNCAVVLVAHLNKRDSAKSLYRTMGSIDFVASARSVLQLSRCDDGLRKVEQIKCSLAPKGDDCYFRIDEDGKLEWAKAEDKKLEWTSEEKGDIPLFLVSLLQNGPVKATEVIELSKEKGYSKRTLDKVKKQMGIKSFKRENQWYWQLGGKDSYE